LLGGGGDAFMEGTNKKEVQEAGENPAKENIESSISPEEQELDKAINEGLEEVSNLIKSLESTLTKPEKNKKVFLDRLKTAKQMLAWTCKKYRLLFKGSPKNVFRKDIFYCELGFNIGSEQSDYRPVVVIQNNRGNKTSPTTMVAVITTHQDAEFKKEGDKYTITYKDEEGKTVTRDLEYYEIPVELEPGYFKGIKGIINMTQIRTISKKRLVGGYVAKISEDTEKLIFSALKRMFDIPNDI